MPHTAIYISGNLISAELIEKLDDDSAIGQRPSDFGLESGTRVRQDIARAWTDANDYWKIFKRKLDALTDTETGTKETRSQWMIPILGLLGYELAFLQQAEIVNDKNYNISHRATNRDALPVMIVSAKNGLDKKPEGTTRYRMSPHALLQEYLNVTEHTYGLVTNGRVLRMLRDNGRITRLSYLEFNLEKIFEEDLYADFALLYRLLHVSRMPQGQAQVAESIVERYYQQAIAAGTRIRSSLSTAVECAIKLLANGLLRHPANEALRRQLASGKMSSLDFYQAQLRLVYRLLFVMTIEERRLVYPEELTAAQQRLSAIYDRHYSLQHLRNLAGKKHLVQGRHHNLYVQLWHNFRLLEEQHYATQLGMKALGSGLFEPGKLQPLDSCKMYNKALLDALWHLSFFTDEESGQTIRANYGALNVEEFGSVYEGFLGLEPEIMEINGKLNFSFKAREGGKEFQSHYTPEELVQPLIKHSLEYLIEDKLKESDPVAALLSLKVCDAACGSGHILLSAARRIALEVARRQYNEEQPSPAHLRWATRQAIHHCIYGVDKNPLAVELCKVALWLEAHNPGEPLPFLDHHIKCGDAIVGLAHRDELEKGIADEAFKTLPGDEKEVTAAFAKRNKAERRQKEQATLGFETTVNAEVEAIIEQYNLFKALPERTPEEVLNRERQYRHYEQDYHRLRLRQLADAQVAQFFISKSDGNKTYLLTDAEYRAFLRQVNKHLGILQSPKLAKAETVAKEGRFFHWFLEFPEVFKDGGFDCILGNPPFLGNRKLTGTFGDGFLEFVKYEFAPIGAVDLVTYFFRRTFSIINENGFLSLISTNTVAQGNAREGGLDVIVRDGGTINHAVKSMRWPGDAAVEVSLITITRQIWNKALFLSGKQVLYITPYLDDAETLGNPYPLRQNEGKCFQGSIVVGKGFLLRPNEACGLIIKSPKNKDVLFPYLNGDDLNNNPDQSASRWIINFFDWSEEKVKEYKDCYEIIEKTVKPERQRWALGKDGNEIVGEYALRKPLPEKWWIYADKRPALYQAILNMNEVIVVPLVSKYSSFDYASTGIVYMHKLAVVALSDRKIFSILSSTIHSAWSWKNSSTLGSGTLNYSTTDCFETFPFPQSIVLAEDQDLETVGKHYHEHRRQLMLSMQLGLTKTYNAFHAPEIKPGLTTAALQGLDKKAVEKAHGKEVWNLWNHLQKTPGTCSLEEVIAGIARLRELHVQMDNAVLEAYGWHLPSPGGEGPGVRLRHDFYPVDYLPENDRTRFTIHPDARKEVLKRLLALNNKIHAEEVALAEANKLLKPKKQKVAKKQTVEQQLSLLHMRPETAYAPIYTVQDIVRVTKLSAQTIKRWLNRLLTEGYQGVTEMANGKERQLLVNFYGMHELIVIYDLRVVNKIPLKDILDARAWLQRKFGIGNANFYPFTTQRVLNIISKAGKEIIFTDEQTNDRITLGRGNSQLNFDFIKDFLKRIVFDKEMVSRLYLSNSHLLAIDPNLAGGRPCTVEKEILIDTIKSAYLDSKDVAFVAKTYEISEDVVNEALKFDRASVLN